MGQIAINLKNTLKNKPNILAMLINIHNLFFSSFSIKPKNKLNIGLAIIKNSKIKISGKNNYIIIKDFSKLTNCNIIVTGNDNTIFIGEKVNLNKTNIMILGNGNEFQMGDFTTTNSIVEFNVLDGTKMEIGYDCMFSRNINLWTGDYHSILDMNGERINNSKNIKIGNHVWVGTETNIFKGTEISDNSVVAAGSLLTKKFAQENIVIAGNPAKIINEKISWVRDNILN